MKFLLFAGTLLVGITGVMFLQNNRNRNQALEHKGKFAEYGIPAWSLKNEKMGFRKSARETGSIGEEIVGAELSRIAHKYGYHLVHDLGMPHRRGNIDHVVVMTNMVLVLDTKNYAGKLSIVKNRSGERTLKVDGYAKTAIVKKLSETAGDIQEYLRSAFAEIVVKPMLVFHEPVAAMAVKTEIALGITDSIGGVEIANGKLESTLAYWSTRRGNVEFDQVAVTEFLLKAYPLKAN